MFGFPKIERTSRFQYKTNFLKSVTFQVRYAQTEIFTHSDGIYSVLKSIFPNKVELFSNKIEFKFDQQGASIPISSSTKDGLRLTTDDSSKVVEILPTQLTYTLKGESYKCFEDFLKEIELISTVFKTCKIETFNRIAVRKINLMKLEGTEDLPALNLISEIFNKDLIGSYLSIPSNDNIQSCISKLTIRKNKYGLQLMFGLIEGPEQVQNAVLDIDMHSNGNIPAESLSEELNEINQEIFNIFNWALLKEALQQLNK